MTTPPVSKYRAAYELGQSALNGRKLVNEAYRWIISRREELVRRLEDGSISREELEVEKEEIRQTEQQLEAFIQQIEVSENKVKKVFGEDGNNG